MPDMKYDIGPGMAVTLGVAALVLAPTVAASSFPWVQIAGLVFGLAGLGVLWSAVEKLIKKPNLREAGIGLVGLGWLALGLQYVLGFTSSMLPATMLLVSGSVISIAAAAGSKLPIIGGLFSK